MKLKAILRPLLPTTLVDYLRKEWVVPVIHQKWVRAGKPLPPPHAIKQMVLREYAQRFQLRILVETGTYRGVMIEAQRRHFEKIYSIELEPTLFRAAQARFKAWPNIQILEGDSGKVLPQLAPGLVEAALFWLDGHYSAGETALGDKECPIYEELETVLAQPYSHVILIDDARCFDGTHDYPTLEALADFVRAKAPQYHFETKDDIIRLTP
ncbi:MAG: hypothetical protein HC913_00010 [Microscillaceae bacterium]|nr:hypothetical protein [Microscillaceae bacterium]